MYIAIPELPTHFHAGCWESGTYSLADITTTDKEVRTVIEMPGLSKNKIKVAAYEDKVEVKSDDPQRNTMKL